MRSGGSEQQVYRTRNWPGFREVTQPFWPEVENPVIREKLKLSEQPSGSGAGPEAKLRPLSTHSLLLFSALPGRVPWDQTRHNTEGTVSTLTAPRMGGRDNFAQQAVAPGRDENLGPCKGSAASVIE